jgi:hypothetical protein
MSCGSRMRSAPQALEEEASARIPLGGVLTRSLPRLDGSNVPPALHGAHHGAGIPPELMELDK